MSTYVAHQSQQQGLDKVFKSPPGLIMMLEMLVETLNEFIEP